jgi:hypothetical protein
MGSPDVSWRSDLPYRYRYKITNYFNPNWYRYKITNYFNPNRNSTDTNLQTILILKGTGTKLQINLTLQVQVKNYNYLTLQVQVQHYNYFLTLYQVQTYSTNLHTLRQVFLYNECCGAGAVRCRIIFTAEAGAVKVLNFSLNKAKG